MDEEADLLLLLDEEEEEESKSTKIIESSQRSSPASQESAVFSLEDSFTSGSETPVPVAYTPLRSIEGGATRSRSREVPKRRASVGEQENRNSVENVREISQRNRLKRPRIPGPAGMRQLQSSVPDTALSEQTRVSSNEEGMNDGHIPNGDDPFVKGPWLSMRRKLMVTTAPNGGRLTISSVLRENFYAKVPEIVVLLSSLSRNSSHCVEATVQDPTGSMQAVIHRDVLDGWKREDFAAGAVLLLKNVSVFTLRIGRHALVVTEKNVARLVPPTASTPGSCHLSSTPKENDAIAPPSRPISTSESPAPASTFQRSILTSLSSERRADDENEDRASTTSDGALQEIFGSLSSPSSSPEEESIPTAIACDATGDVDDDDDEDALWGTPTSQKSASGAEDDGEILLLGSAWDD